MSRLKAPSASVSSAVADHLVDETFALTARAVGIAYVCLLPVIAYSTEVTFERVEPDVLAAVSVATAWRAPLASIANGLGPAKG